MRTALKNYFLKKYRFVLLIIVMTISLNSCKEATAKIDDVKTGLKIGQAEVEYTPEVGHGLVGNYRGDDYASRGVHDPLYGKAMVAEGSNGVKAALLTVDICYIPADMISVMRSYIASLTDIAADHIMIHATHTHSGPPANMDSPDAETYLKKAAEAVIEANKNLTASELSIGRTTEDRVSHNRRLKAVDGTTHMVWEKFEPGFIEKPLGGKDPELIALSIEQEGKTTGTLVNFGCHPTTLTGNNWLYSADYPGYLTESVQKVKGDDFSVQFLNAPSGNITQVDYKVGFLDTFQECQRIGYLLGVAALEAMNDSSPATGDGTVSISTGKVPLKTIMISEEQKAWAEKVMERVAKEGMPALQPDGIPDEAYAKRWLDLYAKKDKIEELEVTALKIGDVAIVGLPGEMFNEFGIYIKENSPFKNTLVIGLTNGSYHYFPTEASFDQGPDGYTPMITGYETTPGTTDYEIGAGEKLAASGVAQLKALFKK